ncbi:uncharacterized protein LOC129565370 [Sitodiplosis mosellana]|uniref:uncharacterized protein LOC129565370 n=1 Tax=Sitodiplosis mosellana TaxID=263140 RepID=UPI002443E4D4|nr:uncharacterized protein LOC129565370 [Sitodiplosis mosellana]
MDILKKMFGLNGAAEKEVAINDKNAKSKVPAFGNDFKKPIWYDEESDDELFDNNKVFGFQVFSNPMEIQKYHEQQLQRMLKTFEQFDDTKGFFDESFREEYMKPGFENFEKFSEVKPSVDVDLDGEIYADQLHSLLQRISPDLENMRAKTLVPKQPEPKRKLTDEEKIMDQIHCIDEEEKRVEVHPFKKHGPPNVRIPHYGGAFEGVIDGPKTHRQTFSYQMVRKPEGTYTTSTVIDLSGNTKTVIKRTVDGETKTQTLVNGVDVDEKNAGVGGITDMVKKNDWIIDCGRHFYVNKNGYALPKNLW